MPSILPALAAAPLLLVVACTQQASQPLPQRSDPQVLTSQLIAGPMIDTSSVTNPLEGDAFALQHGRELYAQMNCAGCHGAVGGGGIGPPLLDNDWIYGGSAENIVQSIMQGRPNGMPAFGARLPEAEAWRIATYVVSLSKVHGAKAPTSRGVKGETSAR